MDYSVIWHPEAFEDIEGIASHIAIDSPAYASAFVQKIVSRAHELRQFPFRGRAVPEWDDEAVREVYVGNYRLIYLVRENHVRILTVIHGAQQLPLALHRRTEGPR